MRARLQLDAAPGVSFVTPAVKQPRKEPPQIKQAPRVEQAKTESFTSALARDSICDHDGLHEDSSITSNSIELDEIRLHLDSPPRISFFTPTVKQSRKQPPCIKKAPRAQKARTKSIISALESAGNAFDEEDRGNSVELDEIRLRLYSPPGFSFFTPLVKQPREQPPQVLQAPQIQKARAMSTTLSVLASAEHAFEEEDSDHNVFALCPTTIMMPFPEPREDAAPALEYCERCAKCFTVGMETYRASAPHQAFMADSRKIGAIDALVANLNNLQEFR
jgi:hypothetical protein